MRGLSLLLIVSGLFGQQLPGTRPLTGSDDPAKQMVEGIHKHLLRLTTASQKDRRPERQEFTRITGVVDPRVPFDTLELSGDLLRPALRFEDAQVRVTAVRWPAIAGIAGEGLYFEPRGNVAARLVFMDDASSEPEYSDIPWKLSRAGYAVLVPALIDRESTWSGKSEYRFTTQSHREFLYRMSYPLGRHIIGFEIQKVLAAVDWFTRQDAAAPVIVWGYGEGGLLALYSAALDTRIHTAVVSGYFDSRQKVWQEPIYRNVWGLLKNFGDAEIAAMAERVIVETKPGPARIEPPEQDPKRRPGAPGVLEPAAPESVQREIDRARQLGAKIQAVNDALPAVLKIAGTAETSPGRIVLTVPAARRQRQFDEIVAWCQNRIRQSEKTRTALWAKADTSSPEKFRDSAAEFRKRHHDEIIGRLPAPELQPNPRTRLSYKGEKWDGYEVKLDLWDEVFAYGVILVPKDLKPGERRPVVVCQHGLEGRPQSMFGYQDRKAITDEKDGEVYRTIGKTLADQGFVVYMPQNPYIGNFRQIARIGNPIKLTLFSYVYSQTERMLDWLETLPFVDKTRIGFYGLSYGGKTAVRIPPIVDRYVLSICSGDFNEWVYKLTTVDAPYSYMFTHEYEILEFGLADFANHSESAFLIFPRPFMVERGHRDGVGADEWVTFEYAKVKRLYDEMGIGDRTAIEYFNGVHRINGVGTVEFLKRFLNWP